MTKTLRDARALAVLVLSFVLLFFPLARLLVALFGATLVSYDVIMVVVAAVYYTWLVRKTVILYRKRQMYNAVPLEYAFAALLAGSYLPYYSTVYLVENSVITSLMLLAVAYFLGVFATDSDDWTWPLVVLTAIRDVIGDLFDSRKTKTPEPVKKPVSSPFAAPIPVPATRQSSPFGGGQFGQRPAPFGAGKTFGKPSPFGTGKPSPFGGSKQPLVLLTQDELPEDEDDEIDDDEIVDNEPENFGRPAIVDMFTGSTIFGSDEKADAAPVAEEESVESDLPAIRKPMPTPEKPLPMPKMPGAEVVHEESAAEITQEDFSQDPYRAKLAEEGTDEELAEAKFFCSELLRSRAGAVNPFVFKTGRVYGSYDPYRDFAANARGSQHDAGARNLYQHYKDKIFDTIALIKDADGDTRSRFVEIIQNRLKEPA